MAVKLEYIWLDGYKPTQSLRSKTKIVKEFSGNLEDLDQWSFDGIIEAGLNIEGINAEVASGQWEFQIFAKGAKEAGDQIWVARYLLERIGEKYGVAVNWHCKPLGALDWNGSGMHANFSNSLLRNAGSREIFERVCESFRDVVEEHIDVYGADNH